MSASNRFKLFIVVCSVYFGLVLGYKPVIIVHGVMTGNETMLPMAQRIQELHPGTKVFVTDRFGGWSSLRPMWHQVMEIGSDILQFMAFHPDGVHLIAKFLHIFFPTLACETAYELFYSSIGQHTSVGNYWNDPYHQKLFFEYSAFLPYVNNLVSSESSKLFKKGFTKIKKLVLIGGPDDSVITPWQSSQFGCFNNNGSVIEMRDQLFYRNDSFGLLTMDSQKKIDLVTLSGLDHSDWHTNMTVLDNYIIPYLD
ncbi:lysosomal thioesterase PPT2 homolog isoform X2 [Halyomorpha halys]|uniref:lysosomal thioesterase PPT2 homolog isoform X2 n=1 Tax=Halyomorpha halys TaxID=286706 RepID=UPI0006D4D712|nr:lysosomal thioesterase PPT2 homolog isoform X2 [Halyomorpha halys]